MCCKSPVSSLYGVGSGLGRRKFGALAWEVWLDQTWLKKGSQVAQLIHCASQCCTGRQLWGVGSWSGIWCRIWGPWICRRCGARLSSGSRALEGLQSRKAPGSSSRSLKICAWRWCRGGGAWSIWTWVVVHRLAIGEAMLLPNVVRPRQDPLMMLSCCLKDDAKKTRKI